MYMCIYTVIRDGIWYKFNDSDCIIIIAYRSDSLSILLLILTGWGNKY